MSKLLRFDPYEDGEQYVLYTDAKASHEQLLAALNDLITAIENDDHVFLALSHAKEQAEKLKEI